MRRTNVLILALVLLGGGVARAGEIHSYLQSVLSNTAPDKPVSTLVFLADQVDLDALTAELDARNAKRRERHERVVRALKAKAAATQADLFAELQRRRTEGSVESFEAFWISALPQNSWVESRGNRLRRFPRALSWGFFPLQAGHWRLDRKRPSQSASSSMPARR